MNIGLQLWELYLAANALDLQHRAVLGRLALDDENRDAGELGALIERIHEAVTAVRFKAAESLLRPERHPDAPLSADLRTRAAALRAEGTSSAAAAADELESLLPAVVSLETATTKALGDQQHTAEWYALRFEVLKGFAQAHGIWPEVAAIIANGSPSASAPPDYAQLRALASHRGDVYRDELRAIVARLPENDPQRAKILEALRLWL